MYIIHILDVLNFITRLAITPINYKENLIALRHTITI